MAYIKIPPLNKLPDSSLKKRKLTDDVWINNIFHFILKYCQKADTSEIKQLIEKELEKQQAEIEKVLKEHIYNFLDNDTDFGLHGFIVNLEPKNIKCNKEGFYDLKFQHSDWQKKYFSFEAKNLGKIKSKSQAASIDEYVYVKSKNDGGMYRYFTGKYACELNFGGMLGFIVGENKGLIKKLKDKILLVYNNHSIGNMVDELIMNKSIENNENTFTTIHKRKNNIIDGSDKFYLHHILLDFTSKD